MRHTSETYFAFFSKIVVFMKSFDCATYDDPFRIYSVLVPRKLGLARTLTFFVRQKESDIFKKAQNYLWDIVQGISEKSSAQTDHVWWGPAVARWGPIEIQSYPKKSKKLPLTIFFSNMCFVILDALSVVNISARSILPSSSSRNCQKRGGGDTFKRFRFCDPNNFWSKSYE